MAATFGRAFLQEGDEILVSNMEHHSNIVPWQLAAEQYGAKIRVIPIDDNGEILLEEYDKLLSPKTKLVAICHVSNALGTINPVKLMVDKAHAVGAYVLVDGAQAVPHMPVDVQGLGADFYAFSGHKAYGPTGVGILYGKYELLEKLPPYQGGGDMVDKVSFDKTLYQPPPLKFEAGTPNISGAIAFGYALDYLNEIGLENIYNYENELLDYATKSLKQIDGLKIYGDVKNKTSVISFNIENLHPYDIGSILDKFGIAVRTGQHCAQPIMDHFHISGTVRVSLSFINTKKEVDKLIEAINMAKTMLS